MTIVAEAQQVGSFLKEGPKQGARLGKRWSVLISEPFRDLLDALGTEGFQYPIDEERFRILLAELSGDTAGTLERGRRAMAIIEGYAGVHQTQSVFHVAALEAVACSNLLNARWQPSARSPAAGC